MGKRVQTALVVGMLFLGLATASLALAASPAAQPIPGGTYRGGTAKGGAVKIVVSRHRMKGGVYRATFTYCGLKVGIFIVHGRFGARITTAGGLVTEFRAAGYFKTRKLAVGRINLDFSSRCKGLPGNWSARLKK